MKLRKKGFTFTEMLITLGIIGVIAALTVPLLSTQLHDKTAGKLVAKTVAQLELGLQNVIQFTNDNYDDGGYADTLGVLGTNNLDEWISVTHISTSVISDSNISDYVTYLGLKENTEISKLNGVVVKGVNGKKDSSTSTKLAATTPYMVSGLPVHVGIRGYLSSDGNNTEVANKSVKVGEVYVDTNGFTSQPNQLGYDIFTFEIRNNGRLYPMDNMTKKLFENDYNIVN